MEKRLLALLLAAAASMSLTACAGGQPAASQPQPADDGNSTQTGLSGDLLVWSWDLALVYLQEAGDVFTQQNPGVRIEYEEMGTDQVYNKLTTSLASGSGLPDLVTVEGEQMGKFGSKFPDKFIDLSSEVDPEDFLSIKVAEASTDGKLLAFPWDAAPCLMFYRTDLFEQAGLDAAAIKTWEDYIEAGKAVLEKTGVAMMPLATSRRDHLYRIALMQQGKFYFDENGSSTVNTPESINAMNLTKKLFDSGITVNDTSWDDYVTSIKEGKVATVPDGIWMAGTIKDLMPDYSGKWGVMNMPQYSGETTGESSNGGSLLAVPSSTKSPEAAVAFGKFAMTNQEILEMGLKEYGFYPSYINSFGMEAFSEADAYFSGAKLGEIFSETAQKIPAVNYTQNFSEALETTKNAVAKVVLKGEDVTETMNNLQDEFATKFGK